MKIICEIIIVVVVLLYIGNTTITIYPFSIKMEDWYRPVGLILICAGVSLFAAGEYQKGKAKGQDEILEELTQKLEEKEE